MPRTEDKETTEAATEETRKRASMGIAKRLAIELLAVVAAFEKIVADNKLKKAVEKEYGKLIEGAKELANSTGFKELKSPAERIAEITAEINELVKVIGTDPEAAVKMANASRRLVAARDAQAALDEEAAEEKA